jgi:hypothetical protein
MSRYAIIEGEKMFKVHSGGAGGTNPYLSQYDNAEYNHIATITTVSNTQERSTTEYVNEVVARGIELAAMHDDCGKEKFSLVDTDERIKLHQVKTYL